MTYLVAERLAIARSGRWLVRGLSFAVAPGQALALTGANGSGKSTLLCVCAGLRTPDSGRVLYAGQPILADSLAHGLRLAWVGHENGLKAELTVRENLACWLALRRPDLAPALRVQRVAAALTAAALDFIADRPVAALSYGLARRVALARLDLMGSELSLWLLDEPTVGLDAVATTRFAALAEAYLAAGGAMIVATHHALPFQVTATLSLADFAATSAGAA